MLEGPLVAAALVLAGSIHCIGMCGGFVVAVAAAGGRAPLRLLAHQSLLQIGKAASYAFLGALAGGFGAVVAAHPLFGAGERLLAILAGLAILVAGLVLLGAGGARAGSATAWLGEMGRRVMGPLFEQKPAGFPLVVGMVMGFLPCPLVFAALGAAAATGSAAKGALLLGGVALGTIPALALVAVAGSAFPLALRRNLARVAGVLLVVTGLVTGARGVLNHTHCAHHDSGGSKVAPEKAGDCCKP
jgi:sulfite exporter TauE/SafE